MNNVPSILKRSTSSRNFGAIQRYVCSSQSPATGYGSWACSNGGSRTVAPAFYRHLKTSWGSRIRREKDAFTTAQLPPSRQFASIGKGPKAQKPLKHTRNPSGIRRLGPGELAKVYGGMVDVNLGNELLQAIQTQRYNGTLDEDLTSPGVTRDMVARGLGYLREHYYLDEDAAIRRRIREEEEAVEQTALAEIQAAKKWQPQQSAKEDGVYGKSKVEEAVSNYNEYRKNVAKAREEYRQQRRENTEVVFEEEHAKVGSEIQRKITEVHITSVGDTKIRRVKNTSYAPLEQSTEDQVEELSQRSSEPALIKAPGQNYSIRRKDDRSKDQEKWWHKYEKQAQLTDWNGISEPPEMPLHKRWGLPTLFMLLTVGASVLFAQSYRAPSSEARMFPSVPPAATTVLALISLNFVAWVLWKVPPMWRTMNKYMLLHAVIPKPFQLLGNTFSHQQFSHLAMNMILLWFVGTNLCDQIGRGNFLGLYVGGGVFASWLSLTHLLLTKQYLQATLGASGATFAVLACYLYLNAGRHMEWILFPGEWKPKFQAEYVLAFMFFFELGGALYYIRSQAGRFDHFAHLGGILAGVSAAHMLRRRVQARRRSLLR